jgi:hypothetical protein
VAFRVEANGLGDIIALEMAVRPTPNSQPPYAPEFRRQMVELGRTPEELSREFEPTAQAIWNRLAPG